MSLHAARPKILGFISEDASAWLVALLALLAGGLLTVILAVTTHSLYVQQLRQRFDLLASERTTRIEERLTDQVQRLDSLRRFVVYANPAPRAGFDGFARPLLARTQAYSWMPRVIDEQREQFEAAARAQGLADFRIRQIGANRALEPASRREVYYPVFYTQSLIHLPAPFGLDIGAEGVRKATLEQARKSGRMAVSSPLTLIGVEPQYSRGVLLVAPVVTVASGELSGFVSAIISIRQLLADGLPASSEDSLHVEISDLSTDSDHEVLFRSDDSPVASDLKATQMLHLADRTYQLDISPSQFFVQSNPAEGLVLLCGLGALLSLLLSAMFYMLVSQRQRAQRRVEQRTWQLRVSEQELRATHNQLRNILDAATQVAIIATDLRGVITLFNVGAQKMLGYRAEDAVGRLALIELHLPEELLARAASISQQIGREVPLGQAMLIEPDGFDDPHAQEWTLIRRNGSHVMVNMLATTVVDEQGHSVGNLAICIDITESREVLRKLAARDRLLEKLSAEVPGGIFQFRRDPGGIPSFAYVSQGLGELYELDCERLMADGWAAMERIHPDDQARIEASIRESAEALTPWREEYRVVLPKRGVRWIRGESTPEPETEGGTLWHGYLSDITDLKQIEEELRALSVTDVLTGIFNRRYFQQRLQSEMDRSQRDHLQMSLIMLDIDHFKRINDQFGHAIGDKALQALSERIGQRVRRTDVFCRLGGEEFVVLCPNANGQQAYALACELWQALRSAPIDGVGRVTASFGVASWRPGEGADALLLRADSGVYAAKQAGRDRVEPELP
ncbi:diguanylate cyclase [Pseudomonas sp. dw_358]|uniref:sensor domain-containing diguanylate cyclase n=1 Tax=Pseudomonas sp. dw_358 TaxID=2720083 RepID=UPI001BD64259|nr:diguanylate cyclase [Pseudomonas sp. dw_358]